MITPWNFPFAMPGLDLPPALAAGCAVLLKPSEVTPLSAVEFVRGWNEVGAPPVLALTTGYGATGAAVIEHVDMIQFTGSTATGKKVAVACAERLIPCSLELGGKDPAIVLADADVDRAANGITWGGVLQLRSGVCLRRAGLRRGADLRRVRRQARRQRPQAAAGQRVRRRLHLRPRRDGHRRPSVDIVERHVAEATAAGATVLTGGKPTGQGTFFQPTVLTDVTQDMTCIAEETFGPTLPVIKVADEEEAIRLANDSSLRPVGDGVDR